MTSLVRLTDVFVTLGEARARVEILKGATLTVGAGETLGLVGPSGSGKSTLLMVLAGLESANAGSVMVAGTELTRLDEDALAAFRGRHIGIVFQAFHLIQTMTALENVAVPLELAGVPDAHERAAAELALVGLGQRLSHYPGELSGGEQQRVAVARALAPRPKLLIADEPTGNLDRKTGREVADLLFKAAAERAMTLVLVTHDPELAARCQRTVSLSDGRIVDAPLTPASVVV